MNLINICLLSMTITWIMMNLSKPLKENKNKKKESSSNFECGFENQSEKNTMFSGQFFMVALLFIIFDMEISLFIPFLKLEDMNNFKVWNIFIIISLLSLGTMLEWKMGMIEWSK